MPFFPTSYWVDFFKVFSVQNAGTHSKRRRRKKRKNELVIMRKCFFRPVCRMSSSTGHSLTGKNSPACWLITTQQFIYNIPPSVYSWEYLLMQAAHTCPEIQDYSAVFDLPAESTHDVAIHLTDRVGFCLTGYMTLLWLCWQKKNLSKQKHKSWGQ